MACSASIIHTYISIAPFFTAFHWEFKTSFTSVFTILIHPIDFNITSFTTIFFIFVMMVMFFMMVIMVMRTTVFLRVTVFHQSFVHWIICFSITLIISISVSSPLMTSTGIFRIHHIMFSFFFFLNLCYSIS
jgi:hypothetical protein